MPRVVDGTGVQKLSRLLQGAHSLVQLIGTGMEKRHFVKEGGKWNNSIKFNTSCVLTMCQADGKEDRADPGLAPHRL